MICVGFLQVLELLSKNIHIRLIKDSVSHLCLCVLGVCVSCDGLYISPWSSRDSLKSSRQKQSLHASVVSQLPAALFTCCICSALRLKDQI